MSGVTELITNTAAQVSSRWRDATDPQTILSSLSLAQADILIQRDGESTVATTTATSPVVTSNGNGVLSIPLTALDLNFLGYATVFVRPPAAIEQSFRVCVVATLSQDQLNKLGTPAVSIAADIAAIDLSGLAEKTDLEPLALEDSVTALADRLPSTLTDDGLMRSDIRAVNGALAAAVGLALSTGQIVPTSVDATDFAPTLTQFDTAVTTVATNHYYNRLIVFTSGSLEGQAATIRGYQLVAGKGRFTVSALTSAPSGGDNFIIV